MFGQWRGYSRRWIRVYSAILAFALCQSARAANTAFTSCGPAAATSCGSFVSTPTFGDALVSWAYNGTTATVPTTPTGWTLLTSSSGNVNAGVIGWKPYTGDANCGAWTNATVTYCEVYKGVYITGSLGAWFGANSSGATGASGALSYPTFTLSNPFALSWAFCAGGSTSGSIDTAPSGMLLRSGTSITNVAFSDTAGSVSTWPTTAGPNPGVKWATACAEIEGMIGVNTGGFASNLVFSHHYSNNFESCVLAGGSCTWTGPIPSTSLSSNYLHFHFSFSYSTTDPPVTNVYINNDTGHATWTVAQNVSHNDAGNNTHIYDYSVTGATAGATSWSIVTSAVWIGIEADYEEWSGIATTTPVDASNSQSNSNSYPSPGSISTTQTGDLIVTHCTQAALGQLTATGIFVSGGVDGLAPDPQWMTSTSAFIENGMVANFVPIIYAAGFNGGNDCTVVALKRDATKGTQPSGVSLASLIQVNIPTTGTITIQDTNISAGDTIMLGALNSLTAGATQFSTVGFKDTLGDTFTFERPTDAVGGYPNYAFDNNIFAGENQFTVPGTAGGQYFIWEFRGLKNSSHSAAFDLATVGHDNSGPPWSPGTGGGGTSIITPGATGGVVVVTSETNAGPQTSISAPTGSLPFIPFYTGQSDSGKQGAGNLAGILFNPSTGAEIWAFACSTGVNATCSAATAGAQAQAIHFLSATGGSGGNVGACLSPLNVCFWPEFSPIN